MARVPALNPRQYGPANPSSRIDSGQIDFQQAAQESNPAATVLETTRCTQHQRPKNQQARRDLNPDRRFWRPVCYHYTTSLSVVPEGRPCGAIPRYDHDLSCQRATPGTFGTTQPSAGMGSVNFWYTSSLAALPRFGDRSARLFRVPKQRTPLRMT